MKILTAILLTFALVGSAQQRGTQPLTDAQLDAIQCQARITDRDVTIEKLSRKVTELEAKKDREPK